MEGVFSTTNVSDNLMRMSRNACVVLQRGVRMVMIRLINFDKHISTMKKQGVLFGYTHWQNQL